MFRVPSGISIPCFSLRLIRREMLMIHSSFLILNKLKSRIVLTLKLSRTFIKKEDSAVLVMIINGTQKRLLRIFWELTQQLFHQDISNKLQKKNRSDQANSSRLIEYLEIKLLTTLIWLSFIKLKDLLSTEIWVSTIWLVFWLSSTKRSASKKYGWSQLTILTLNLQCKSSVILI